jgi:2-oxoisovalerate dehydrogenase E2 component (dihydrolipoyl transacylase)
MAVELEMPELAESVIEGEIVKWLVKEGEHVKQDQPLVEVMTDKVTVEVPSPYEGILLKQIAPEGAVVPIGKPIAIFGKEGESVDDHHAAAAAPAAEKPAAVSAKPAAASSAASAAPAAAKPPARGNGQAHKVTSEGETAVLSRFGRPLAAPAVRKLAR